MLLTAAALQFSIAAANIFLALMLASWLFLTAADRERVRLPAAFWWPGAYAYCTMPMSAAMPPAEMMMTTSTTISAAARRDCSRTT